MNSVPLALADRPQWIVWRYIQRGKLKVKMPFNPLTLRVALTTNAADWATLAQAETAMATGRFSGLGFVLVGGGGIVGIDLDSCFADLLTFKPWATEILRSCSTYAEISPSGRGVKLFALGDYNEKPLTVEMGGESGGGKRAAVELHGRNQFFAFTGNRFPDTPATVNDCSEWINRFVRQHRPTTTPRPTTPRPTPTNAAERSLEERGRLYLAKVPVPQCGTGRCQKTTFRAAVVLVKNIGLDPRWAFTLLREWAANGEHPWTDAELHRKIADALKSESNPRS